MKSKRLLNKNKIIKAFSKGAKHYDGHAAVQKSVAKELCDIVCSLDGRPKNILDVGTGTGEVAFLLAEKFSNARIIGCDIAPGMVSKAKKKNTYNNVVFEIADAEKLPFDDGIFDLIVSGSTYQWVENLLRAFREACRVSHENSYFVFNTYGSKTLNELKRSFIESYDKNAKYFHRYQSLEGMKALLAASGFEVVSGTSKIIKHRYKSLKEIFNTIKKIGALNASNTLPTGLRARLKMQGLIKAYEENYKDGDGVYATYEPLTFVCKKG